MQSMMGQILLVPPDRLRWYEHRIDVPIPAQNVWSKLKEKFSSKFKIAREVKHGAWLWAGAFCCQEGDRNNWWQFLMTSLWSGPGVNAFVLELSVAV